MKRFALLLAIPLLLIFSVPSANAGISLGKGGITLPAGQSEDMCDVWVYATQEGGEYHVETTGDLKSITAGITPNDFALTPIDCPQETGARRACITEKCLSSDQSSCRVVCIKFAAPLVFSWSAENIVYQGSILNSIRIGFATIKEPYAFSVHVEPLDMKPIVLVIAALSIAVVIVAAVFVSRRRKSGKK